MKKLVVRGLLAAAAVALLALGAVKAQADGCGPGYVNCNGICMPECDNPPGGGGR